MADLEDAAGAAGYDIVGFAGRGGSGEVYRSVSKASGETVALKVLDGDVDQRRLEREGMLLSRIQHPGVARFIETGALGERRFLAMEWLDGESLAALIMRDAPLEEGRAVAIARQLAAALDEVHRNGVVHRDLSPANVMIGAGDRATIIDFGIGRAPDTATITADHSLIGTARYMAPEIIEGSPPTAASDQYSLAIMVYEMLTRSWPFGDGEHIATTLHHQLNTQPIPVSEITGAAPSGIDLALERALSKDPTDRFASCASFVDAFLAPAPPQPTGSSGTRRVVAVLLALGLVATAGLAIWVGSRTPGSEVATVGLPTWEAGTASGLSCNLLTAADFEAGLTATNYFVNEDPSVERIRTAPGTGVEGTQALQVGSPDAFGLYGETIAVDANQTYLFSAHTMTSGEVAEATIQIDWLDTGWAPLETPSVSGNVISDSFGRSVVEAIAPAGAGYAVPMLFKDGSPGVLFADELVFAAAGTGCDATLKAES